MTRNKKSHKFPKTDDMEFSLSVFIYYNLQNNFSWYNCFLKPLSLSGSEFSYNQAIHKNTLSNKACLIFL